MLPTIAISKLPKFLISVTSTFTSGLLPLLLIIIRISSCCIIPRSPCIASAACINIDGVPVLLKVATIFWAIIALLPMPLTTSRPFDAAMLSTAFTKLPSINSCNFFIEPASNSIVRRADDIIFSLFIVEGANLL